MSGGGDSYAEAMLLDPGEAVLKWLVGLHDANGALTLSNRVIMPDHVHFILIVDFDRDPHFDPISFAHEFQREGARGAQPPVLWERDFWMALSFSSRQLSAVRRYIRGNPARAIWKASHPDCFRVFPAVRHAALDAALKWSGMGNSTLLASPFLFPVRLTRKLPVERQKQAIDEAVERALNGMVPVCGFISPAEHELEKRLRGERRTRWIKMLPHGLDASYDPSLEDSRAIASGRMLLLSSFAPGIPVSPVSRANCETMNSRILKLCGEAAEAVSTRAV